MGREGQEKVEVEGRGKAEGKSHLPVQFFSSDSSSLQLRPSSSQIMQFTLPSHRPWGGTGAEVKGEGREGEGRMAEGIYTDWEGRKEECNNIPVQFFSSDSSLLQLRPSSSQIKQFTSPSHLNMLSIQRSLFSHLKCVLLLHPGQSS